MFYKFDLENQIKNIISKNIIDFKRASNVDLTNKSEYISDIHVFNDFITGLAVGDVKPEFDVFL